SRLIPYVPLGEDATVINEFIDLKIKNNQPNPVIFTCTIDGSKLQVDIWGRQLYPGESVKLVSVVDKKIPFPIITKTDPNLKPGKVKIEKPGVNGYEVSLFRTITKDNREIKKELISKSYYVAVPEIMNVSPYQEQYLF
ncbi:MAG TPA: G5 domain-containing protein, partial [Bacillota bacterium]|nr:G5 domain-containing protein [Bacillota bacterium]